MNVYNYDRNGIYTNSEAAWLDQVATEHLKKDTYLLPAQATFIKPPKVKVGQVAVFDGTKWRVEEDHRGKTAYHTRTRAAVLVTQVGVIDSTYTLLAPATTAFDEWKNGAWVTDTQAQLVSKRASKLQELNKHADAAIERIVGEYPLSERLSWAEQMMEANAYKADASSPTPLLKTLAASKGTTVDVVAKKVLAKAAIFTQVSGKIFGQRQRVQNALETASTIAALDAIVVDIS